MGITTRSKSAAPEPVSRVQIPSPAAAAGTKKKPAAAAAARKKKQTPPPSKPGQKVQKKAAKPARAPSRTTTATNNNINNDDDDETWDPITAAVPRLLLAHAFGFVNMAMQAEDLQSSKRNDNGSDERIGAVDSLSGLGQQLVEFRYDKEGFIIGLAR